MSVGQIYWYHADNLGGRLIQWRTKGPYSHVCVEVRDDLVIEARWPKVLLDNRGIPAKIYTPKFPDPTQLDRAVGWLYTTVGDNYNLWDIVANVFPFVLGKNITGLPTAFICSQLTTIFLIKAGYIFPSTFLEDSLHLQLVTPNGLARLLGVL